MKIVTLPYQSTITEGDYTLQFLYGHDKQRRKTSFYNENGIAMEKYFVGLYEKEVEFTEDGIITRHINYITAGDGMTAIVLEEQQGEEEVEVNTYFTYKDHLGSIVALTDEDANVVIEQSFSAWGRYRNPDNWSSSNVPDSPTWLRGYTGHEHLPHFDLINMNGRIYDPVLGRMLSPDNYVQDPLFSQSYNRYSYVWNNPLRYTDPSGDFVVTTSIIVGVAIGAGIGAYQGWQLGKAKGAEGWEMAGYIAGGTLIGGATGLIGGAVATSGGFMASTSSIVFSSTANSMGMNIMSKGQTDVSIGFGAGSYNATSNEFGYLGKEGNSTMENVGYSLGALTNVSDVLMGFNSNNIGEVDLVTEHSDAVGHSALVKKGTRTSPLNHGPDPNGIISVGPDKRDPASWHWKKGKNTWSTYSDNVSKTWRKSINVNLNRVSEYGNYLNKRMNAGKLIYSVELSSCVTHTSRALNLSGVFNIGLHPHLLHAQMYLRSIGIRPMLYSHFLYH